MINVAVFVSGRGSNLRAIVEYFQDKSNAPKIKLVFSDKLNCPALNFAKSRKIKTYSVSVNAGNGKISWDEALDILKREKTKLIVLAGFLKKIPSNIITEFERKIINIHPALLPSFGGKGMYGMNVHKAVYESKAKVSGATVHFVNENYDEGEIIAQSCVDISKANSPEEIAEKVLSSEHELLPYVISKFAEQKVITENGRVKII